MQTDNNHIKVNTIRWELFANSMTTAMQWQEITSHYGQHRLPATIESGLEPHNDNEQVLYIDQLELDLQQITSEEQLDLQIRKLIAEKISNLIQKNSIKITGQRQDALHWQASLIKGLENYFFKGSTGWQYNSKDLQEPEKIYSILNEWPVHKLKEWVGKFIPDEKAFVRFLEYFTEKQLSGLFSKIFPGTVIDEMLESVCWLLQETKIAATVFLKYHALIIALFKEQVLNKSAFHQAWWKSFTEEKFNTKEDIQKITRFILSREEQKDEFPAGVRIAMNGLLVIVKNMKTALPGEKETSIAYTQQNSASHDEEQSFMVENAGVILLYPFLAQLFREHGWLNDENEFIDHKQQLEACYLLQFITTGERDVKEYELLLNKLLCGYPKDAPVSRTWDREKAITEDADSFLQGIIEQFPKLGVVTPAGLRNSFLLRAGKLIEEDLNWQLIIERKSWDMLLDTLPYPISIIKLPWMLKPLYVQW